MRKPLLQHNLLWILLFTIFVLGILTIALCFSAFKRTSDVVSNDMPYSEFGVKQLRSRDWQKYVEALVTKKLRLRNLFIRTNSQLYYSLFHKSFAEDSQVIVGKHKQLFEVGYITSYCHLVETVRDDDTQLIAWADKIKKLNDFFEQHGKTFIYLITPSKAEYMPENIPDRFHCRNRGVSAHLKMMEKLLTERKIHYVNGAEIMVAATQQYGVPMFPTGGTHWNWLGASVAANAIIDAINRDGRVHVNPLQFDYEMTTHPRGADADLLKLIKLMKPDMHYPVPKVTYHDAAPLEKPVTIAFVGGSFIEGLLRVFVVNKTFAKMSHYFYFVRYKDVFEVGKKKSRQEVLLSSSNVLDSVLSADVFILEENSAITVSHHALTFYDELHKRVKEV